MTRPDFVAKAASQGRPWHRPAEEVKRARRRTSCKAGPVQLAAQLQAAAQAIGDRGGVGTAWGGGGLGAHRQQLIAKNAKCQKPKAKSQKPKAPAPMCTYLVFSI
jgi:hypothetical protein